MCLHPCTDSFTQHREQSVIFSMGFMRSSVIVSIGLHKRAAGCDVSFQCTYLLLGEDKIESGCDSLRESMITKTVQTSENGLCWK